MEKEVVIVKACSDILKLKNDFPNKLDDDLIRDYIKKANFDNDKERLLAIKSANLALKIISKEKLTEKKIIQKVLESLK